MSRYYIASCVFTTRYPALSKRILDYIHARGDLSVVRCCVPNYKTTFFTEKLPKELQDTWTALPDSANFGAGDTVYSLCHNCTAILEEWKPQATVRSLWELLNEDAAFPLPDLSGTEWFVQDCWRLKDHRAEQDAVRSLLHKAGAKTIELPDAFEKTEFCGNSLYREAPPRNAKLAPVRFGRNAGGKFLPRSEAEQKVMMETYCKRFMNRPVVAYCHYCTEGLLLGGANAVHIAELLFGGERRRNG